MTPDLKPIGAAELALRLMARRGRGDWVVLVAESGEQARGAAEALAREIEAVGGVDVEHVHDARDTADLAARLTAARGPAVVAGLDGWPASEWGHVDRLRSQLTRDERTALVAARTTFEHIMREAPNFSSWLGAGAWRYEASAGELTEEERARRLETLRAWSGLSDEEVIARGEGGTLPAEPEYAEWLVLLDRGDLLER